MGIAKLLGSILLASLMMGSVAQAGQPICLITISNCETKAPATKTYPTYSRGNQFGESDNQKSFYFSAIIGLRGQRQNAVSDFSDLESCEKGKKSFEQSFATCQ